MPDTEIDGIAEIDAVAQEERKRPNLCQKNEEDYDADSLEEEVQKFGYKAQRLIA